MSKKDMLAKVNAIRVSYPYDEPLLPEHQALMEEVLKGHPQYEEKIGCGIDYIYLSGGAFNSTCFWIRRKDGSKVAFSYKACIQNNSADAELRKALRCTVQPYIEKLQAANPGKVMHHSGPNTFKKIADEFISECRACGVEIQMKSVGRFLDARLEDVWISFHNRKATLVALTYDEHKRIHESGE